MARSRKKGLFDPDYRRAGWNRSAFAPKNSSLSITHLSLVIVFPIWAGVLLASPFKIINTVQGIGISFGVMVVAWILNVLTDYKAIPVGGGGDGGADIKVYSGSQLVGIVQCKCYRSGQALPPGHIRELYAARQQFGVRTAYLATTAHFTSSSQAEAKRLGIKLLDGDEIKRMKHRARAILKARDERQAVR